MKKKILSFCLLVGIISFSKAQGNLQFNKAKFIELEGVALPNVNTFVTADSIMLNIATNKVWKIEHYGSSVIDSSFGGIITNSAATAILLLNGVQLQLTANGQAIWLPAGTYKLKLMGYTANSRVKGFISAIEYNIVP